jgi:uncharacterized membrane protein YkoI
MKKNIIASLVIGFCILFVVQTAFADESSMPKNVMKINVAIQKLQAKGYKNIREIEFNDGFYEAEIMTANGNKVEVRVNTKTGAVENPTKEMKSLGILEIVKKVQAAGYHDIYKISFDDGEYEVAAFDKDGKDVQLDVNASTGEIKKNWF